MSIEFFSFIFHIDQYLADAMQFFGDWTYVFLFLIVFAETGFIVAPFLPGDSLLFATGTLAGGGLLNIWTAYFLLLTATILGDLVNYWIGYYLGHKVFSKDNAKFFKKEYLEKTREFYERYGGKAIIIARFLPIIRTFAPFIAGVGRMRYRTFFLYNIFGAFIWVSSIMFVGFYLGNIPLVRENFEYAIIVIITLSVLPMISEYIKYQRGPKISRSQMERATYEEVRETFEKEHLD